MPRDEAGWPSDRLQIWWNHTTEPWTDPSPHAHASSDEVFIVLEGVVVVEVDGERVEIGPNEFCCFPSGLRHEVVETRGSLRTLTIRAPSVDDKV